MKIKSEQDLAKQSSVFEVDFSEDDLKMALAEDIKRVTGVTLLVHDADWQWNSGDRGGRVRWSVSNLTPSR